jgi:hypothetical protein
MFRRKKHSEQTLTWILRGVGFLVMFIGFLLIGGPLSALAGVLPSLEDIVSAGVGLVALALAVPPTLITIALAWIAYRPLVGGVLIVAGVAFAMLLRHLHRARRREAITPAA